MVATFPRRKKSNATARFVYDALSTGVVFGAASVWNTAILWRSATLGQQLMVALAVGSVVVLIAFGWRWWKSPSLEDLTVMAKTVCRKDYLRRRSIERKGRKKLRSFDFYEFTGYLLPGVIILVSLGQIPDVYERASYFVPQAADELGLHLILAYIAGHFIQVIGQIAESSIWRLLGGWPTDAPYKRLSEARYKTIFDQILRLTGEGDVTNKAEWGRRIAIWRSSANRTTGATRLNVFNGNYGMFRGFFTVSVISLGFAWLVDFNTPGTYVFFGLLVIGAASGMRHFGHRYATELFAIAQQESESQQGGNIE